jgi:tRNA pseudouridine55 synthase
LNAHPISLDSPAGLNASGYPLRGVDTLTRRRRPDPPIHGFLNICKPAGWTSFDVVAAVRKQSGVRRVGHGGTLDPMATGVLPIGIGQATRFLEYLLLGHKTYHATIALGVSTNTFDAEGEVIETGDATHVKREDVEALLPIFVGEVVQVPPVFSAIKRQGTPMHRLARAGEDVEVAPRLVTIYSLELTDFRPSFVDLRVECGKGTYIRSIANDLGKLLGCGAHLAALTRTQVGPFRLKDAIAPEAVGLIAESGEWCDYLYAPDTPLQHWNAAIVAQEKVKAVRMGQAVKLDTGPDAIGLDDGARCRLYGLGGDFVAILQYDHSAGIWRPDKVLAAGASSGDS